MNFRKLLGRALLLALSVLSISADSKAQFGSTAPVTQTYTAGSAISQGQPVVANSTASGPIVVTPYVGGSSSYIIGVAQQSVPTGSPVQVEIVGQENMQVDGACSFAQIVVPSSSISAGHCQNGIPSSGQILGLALQTKTGLVHVLISPTVSTAAAGSGGGGSSIFTSFQFGTNTAITGTGNYIQLTAGSVFALTQTGSGTSGSPFVDTISFASQSGNCVLASPNGSSGAPTCRALVNADLPSTAVTPGNYTSANITVNQQGVITSAANGGGALPSGTQGQYLGNSSNGTGTTYATSSATFDCSLGFSGSDWSLKIQACLAALPTANSQAYVNGAGVATAQTFSVNPFANLSTNPASIVFTAPCYNTTVNAQIAETVSDFFWKGCGTGGSASLFSGSSFVASVSITSFTGTSGTIAFTNSGSNGLSANQSMVLSGFTSPNTSLNGQAVTVLASGLSSTTFEAAVTGSGYSSGSGIATVPMVSLGSAAAQRQHVIFSDSRVDCNIGTGPTGCSPFLGIDLQEYSEIERDNFVGANQSSATSPAFVTTNPSGGGHFSVHDISVSKSGANDAIYDDTEGATADLWERITTGNTGFVTGLAGWHKASLDGNPTFSYLVDFHAEAFADAVEFDNHTGGACLGIDSTGTNTNLLHIVSGAITVSCQFLYSSSATDLVDDASLTTTRVLTRTNYPNGIGGYTNATYAVGGWNVAANSYSSSHTLNVNEYWANASATLTFTVPCGMQGQVWDVFNTGTGTMTVSAGTGTVNGAASVSTATQYTGYQVTADGTNCEAAPFSSGSGGAVSSVGNSDGTLTISPTTGSVVASLALGHANAWTALQTFASGNISIAFPVTVAGTVNSGGIPYFNSTTQLSSSSTLTQYGILYGGGTGAAPSTAAPPTTPASVTEYLCSTPTSGGAAQAPTFCLPGNTVDSQTGTSYTIGTNNDRGALVAFNNSSSVAVTVPQAGTGVFISNYPFGATNLGTNTVVLTPTTSTINGAASLTLDPGSSAFIFSDNTNYWSVNIPKSTGGVNAQTTNYTLTILDKTKLVSFNGSSLTATLPSAPPSSLWWVAVENRASTSLTLSPNGLTIDGSSSNITLSQNQGLIVYTDGSNYFTMRGAAGSSGANTALSNLASVAINTSLLPGAGSVDLGSTADPFRNIYIYGASTFGTDYIELTGTPTSTRTATFPDNTGTIAELNLAQTFSAIQTISASNGLVLSAMTGTSCLEEVSGTVTATGSACGSGGGSGGGSSNYTSSQTASSSDNGKIVYMNCTAACAYTLPATQPSNTFYTTVVSIGTTVATIALGGSDTFNGSTTVPTLTSGAVLIVYADSTTSTNYIGSSALTDYPLATQTITAGAAGAVPLIVKAAASTTVDMFDVENSAGTKNIQVDDNNNVIFGNGVLEAPLSTILTIKGGQLAELALEGGPSAGGTNQAGGTLLLEAGQPTGTAALSPIEMEGSAKVASGTGAQTLVIREERNIQTTITTNNTAQTIMTINVANGSCAAGFIHYNVRMSDGTNWQSSAGIVPYNSCANSSGTITNGTMTAAVTGSAVTSGTMPVTWALSGTTSPVNVQVTADSSLTPTVMEISWAVENFSDTNTVTPTNN